MVASPASGSHRRSPPIFRVGLLVFREPESSGGRDGFGASVDAELGPDPRYVVVDGPRRDDELGGDVGGAHLAGEQREDFELACRESGRVYPCRAVGAPWEVAGAAGAQPSRDDPSRGGRTEPLELAECAAKYVLVV